MKKSKGITPRWGATLMAVLLLIAVLYLGAEALFRVSLLPAGEALRGVTGYVGEACPEVMTVPALTGRRFSEDILPDPALFPCRVTYVYHPTAAAGGVISQTPAGGTLRKVSEDRPCTLSLTVSMGRAQAKLPDLSGLDPREAEKTLRRLGLHPRRVEMREIHGAYTVRATRPEAGCLLDRGETVTLLLPRQVTSEAVSVPDLAGMTAAEAADALSQAGLCLGQVQICRALDPWGIRMGGSVCAQTHRAGDLLPFGYTVGITLGERLPKSQEASG